MCDHDPRFDEEYPCEVCGKHIDDCICPECPVCGIQGDPACYDLTRNGHGLVRTPEQVEGAVAFQKLMDEAADLDRKSCDQMVADFQWQKDHAEEIAEALREQQGEDE